MTSQDHVNQEIAPTPNELSSLENVRTTLADDVVQFLAVTTTGSESDALLPRPSDDSSGQREGLLRAAIADLEAMDARLHRARP